MFGYTQHMSHDLPNDNYWRALLFCIQAVSEISFLIKKINAMGMQGYHEPQASSTL